ncbi:MAG: HD domain-containing protein [Desulfarculus sp.]|nr:HD domain-containing protein [Desulfarculus sp.]
MSDKRQDLAGLKEGQAVDEVYLLAKKQIFATKGGKPYGALRLMDPTGEAEAKLWDQAEELLTPLAVGQPVRAQGKVQLYNGQTQLVLSGLKAAPQARAADFLPKSPRDAGQMWAELGQIKQSVQSAHLKKLLRAFFDDPEFRQAFELAPAAKGAHHAYVHGLLEHTVSLAGLASLTAEHYPHLDRDLLIVGALLHDVGKVQELTLGPPLEYTDLGRLEGHVVLGVRMLDARLARLKNFPARLASVLRHMIVSHHGQEQFGSPQKPKLAEAVVLHQLDDLDAKTAMVKAVIEAEAAGEGHWSAFHRLLERHIYTGPPPWDDEPEPVLSEAPPEPEAPARAAKPASQRPSLFDQAPPAKGKKA